ncbi:hypothetical protein L226DRAFT_540781 [Lentinus tigrinus ALCF2SS1-7]|uniref:Uncharacterized protein n=1 Tax=Lentinus tigrinus ALCF2SS1-6 TaxID=1328759 RepID=A0A5C2RSU7_9APHY|nr:hypothetical protein L227DRAFT_617163 [Lentinus tigrinus ALCF2SS1-6]RPD68317.1 hypothetical protein L226DRAFT_540781 [Lentinus tigrinus ALCF2SS1-7]
MHPESPGQQDASGFHGRLSGFLYYCQPPRAPPLAGELRFRLTPSDDPASFSSGVDYTTRRGVPWYIPLPTIAGNQTFAPLQHLLTDVDMAVPRQVMELAREHHHSFKCGDAKGSRVLHAFGQPFDVALYQLEHKFVFVGQKHIARTRFQRMTSFETCFQTAASAPSERERHFPFLGSILCCFEPSTLKEHSGKRVAVIRVLRSLEPDPVRPNPAYTGAPVPRELCPQEGQLLMTLRRRRLKPWAGDVDARPPSSTRANSAAALAVLFDNALAYSSTA